MLPKNPTSATPLEPAPEEGTVLHEAPCGTLLEEGMEVRVVGEDEHAALQFRRKARLVSDVFVKPSLLTSFAQIMRKISIE